MNQIDLDYQNLVRDILENGHKKNDRTGTGTISVFGRTIRHSMKDGFPLLTTKKMAWKTMVTELLWFLRGDTNIKYLVDNDCHIWDGDAYKNYCKNFENIVGDEFKNLGIENSMNLDWAKSTPPLSQEEFINKIKTDDEFAKKWGDLGPVYGKQWRSWKKPNHLTGPCEDEFTTDLGFISKEEYEIQKDLYVIDQIQNLINDLKTNPDSRRMIVNAWNVGELDQMVLPPCHMMFQFYTRELSLDERNDLLNKETNRNHKRENCFSDEEFERETLQDCKAFNIPTRAISLRWDQRSVDVGLGLPFNIASYALLLEIVAKSVNMVPEELIGNLGDCHIYNNHVDGLKEQLTRVPYELPTVKLPKTDAFWKVFDVSLFGHLNPTDFILENYQSHPSIKLPLSN